MHPRVPRLAAALAALGWAAGAAGQTLLDDALPRHDRAGRAVRSAEQPPRLGPTGQASGFDELCAQVIAEDLLLDRDLDCVLRVASGVTVDLGRHTVHGIATCHSATDCGHDGEEVTIRNGTIEGYVAFDYCHRCALERVTVRGHDDFAVELGTENLVVRSRFVDNWVGISSYFGGGRNTVMLSVFEGNGAGLVVGGNDGNVIWGNRFYDNGSGVSLWDEDEYGGSDNLVAGNHFFRNAIGASLHARVEAERNQFVRNLFWGNRGSGLLLRTPCGYAEDPCGGAGTRAEHNLLVANGYEPVLLRFRVFDEGDGDGRVVEVPLDDGISAPLDPRGHAGFTLRANHAIRNADLGIEAPGVVDGGRNKAAANGDPRQCVGVRCRRR